MEYSRIISVTGLGGLFELVGSKADGAIVRSLEDNTTRFVSSRVHSFSHLESIEVYTVRDNVNLVEVLQAMSASKEATPSEKDAAAVKAYFQKVYPDMDFDRVYGSDMKKMVKWFTILKNNNVELKLSEVVEDEDAEEVAVEEAPAVVAEEAKPAKATKAKKATAEVAEGGEEAATPKKRAPRKKKTEEE
ncbi:hypothetical protein SAMN05421788_1011027 [Filimonas lacunae]|uniref:Uncharacterized protein n=1 Tax=Filimonas lacunae TaxID=477680 RepID=A0A173MQD7_9BACT|nr:DUF5606 domain-containing protein [Filimonas lacunae]BAV09591.1 hypothetical protein FLA_5642 [Filimonas lacunae]SIS75635.1 hypothetical protein SAMN05421788_1011027 [Filimonas lacunae]